MSNITAETDPTLYARLLGQYIADKRPAIVVNGSAHYQAIQTVDGEIEFVPKTTEELYGSMSGIPGVDR